VGRRGFRHSYVNTTRVPLKLVASHMSSLTFRLQPRRLMIAAGAVGCKLVLAGIAKPSI
jgi:hypothetical protein